MRSSLFLFALVGTLLAGTLSYACDPPETPDDPCLRNSMVCELPQPYCVCVPADDAEGPCCGHLEPLRSRTE